MATKEPTLADIQAEAMQLQMELQSNPVTASDKAKIVATAKSLLSILDKVQPHLNKADQAFGGQTAAIERANTLRNQINRVIAAYTT